MKQKEYRMPILPRLVAAIIGLSVVVAVGCFEWNVLIPKKLLPVWVHLIFHLWMALAVIGLLVSTGVHLRDLGTNRNLLNLRVVRTLKSKGDRRMNDLSALRKWIIAGLIALLLILGTLVACGVIFLVK